MTFAGEGVYCCLETGSAFARGAGSELISSYISAKEIVNRPSFNLKNLLPLNRNMPARDQCVFTTCWALLCRSVAGSWSDLRFHVWESSGFFYVRTVPRMSSKRTRSPSIQPQINENNLNKKPVNRRENPRKLAKKTKKVCFPAKKTGF